MGRGKEDRLTFVPCIGAGEVQLCDWSELLVPEADRSVARSGSIAVTAAHQRKDRTLQSKLQLWIYMTYLIIAFPVLTISCISGVHIL